MRMNDLIIEPRDKTPGIDFSYGILLFHGRSLVEEPKAFFEPVFAWVKKYIKQPAATTVISIKLEYIDSKSTHALFEIFKLMECILKKEAVLMINWYYAYGDIEMLELGEIIQGRLETEFEFNEFRPDISKY